MQPISLLEIDDNKTILDLSFAKIAKKYTWDPTDAEFSASTVMIFTSKKISLAIFVLLCILLQRKFSKKTHISAETVWVKVLSTKKWKL